MLLRILPILVLAFAAALPSHSQTADPALTITMAGKTKTYTTSQLLNRADQVELTVPADVAYKKEMTYRAVPLLSLLGPPASLTFDTLEARATDGFVSQLPTASIRGGAIAWIAIEPPTKPWPKLPNKSISAGPFFLVWQFPERSNIGPEQWPYALAELRAVRSPMQRWPQMLVAAGTSEDAPARRGMHVYIKHCLSCHKIDGAGEATMGPDLLRPMSPLDYMTVKGLRMLVRDPASVRRWPKQEMSGFAKKDLPERDLDDLMAYLGHMRDK